MHEDRQVPFEQAPGGFELRQQRCLDDHDAGPDDLDGMGERGIAQVGVQQGGCGAGFRDPQPDRQIFGPIGHQQRDRVALAEAARQGPARITVGAAVPLPIREGLPIRNQGDPVREALRQLLCEVAQGAARMFGDRHRAAQDPNDAADEFQLTRRTCDKVQRPCSGLAPYRGTAFALRTARVQPAFTGRRIEHDPCFPLPKPYPGTMVEGKGQEPAATAQASERCFGGPGRIICFGGAAVDRKYMALDRIRAGTSNPCTGSSSFGGVARNVAANLARLGVETSLVSIVGGDTNGRSLVQDLLDLGIDAEGVRVAPGERTAEYVAVLDPDRSLAVGMADMAILDRLGMDDLLAARSRLGTADWIFADGNLSADVLGELVRSPSAGPAKLAVDVVSTPKAERLPRDLRRRRPLVSQSGGSGRCPASIGGGTLAGDRRPTLAGSRGTRDRAHTRRRRPRAMRCEGRNLTHGCGAGPRR